MPGKLSPGLLDKDFAWVVVPETSVDKLDPVPTDCDRLEEGRCRRGRSRDLPNGAAMEASRRVVCCEESRPRVDITLRDS